MKLKTETIQSRYDVLMNSVSSHFFNLLNDLTAFIYKKDDSKTPLYVDKLSAVSDIYSKATFIHYHITEYQFNYNNYDSEELILRRIEIYYK